MEADDSQRFSLSNFTSSVIIVDDELGEEEWTTTSEESERVGKIKSMKSTKSSRFAFSKANHKSRSKSLVSTRMSCVDIEKSLNESTTTNDDLEIHVPKEV